MDEIALVKLERIANAIEKMADAFNHIAVSLDRQANASERTATVSDDEEKIEALRKNRENHFAKIEWETKPNKNGGVAVVRQDSSGQNYIMLTVHNPKYGFCTMFIKHKRVPDTWSQTLKLVDQVGVKFICNSFISWNEGGSNYKPRWTVNFLNFSKQKIQGAPTIQPEQAIVQNGNEATDEEVPY